MRLKFTKASDPKALHKIILKAQTLFIRDEDSQAAFEGLLGDLLELTESEYGFVGEVLGGPGKVPYIKMYALTDISWDAESRALYEKHAAGGILFSNLNTLFGKVLTTGKPVFSQNATSDPRRGGLPPGHPPMDTFGGLPVFVGSEMVGVIGLANRVWGYDQDLVEFLEPLLNTVGYLIERLRLHQEQVQHRLELERLSLVAQHTINGALVTDKDGWIEWVNPGFERITGYTLEEVKGRLPGEMLQGPQTSKEAVQRIRQQLRQGRGFEEDLVNYTKSGEPFWTHVSCTPILDHRNQPKGYIAVQTDITERKQTEVALSQFQSTLDQTLDAVFIFDGDTLRFTYVNQGAVSQLGYSREVLLGMTLYDIAPEYRESHFQEMIAALGIGRRSRRFETIHHTRDGSRIPVSTFLQYIPLDNDRAQFLAIVQDITQQKEAENKLRIAASVFESSYEAIMITGPDNRVVDVNPAFTRITGYERDEIIGKIPRILSSGKSPQNLLSSSRHSDSFYKTLSRSIEEKGFWHGEIWERRKNGEQFPELLSVTRVSSDQPGSDWHHVAMFSDITTLKNHAEELDRAAHYDELTNLPNRRLLADRIEQAIHFSNRHQKPLAICFIDLDNFKTINDHHGHSAGDLVLKAVAERLKAALRHEDTVSRVGGDEFVLLLVDSPDSSVFDRILEKISEPIFIGSTKVTPSASIGITLYPQDSSDSERLLRHADQALYAAKEDGRHCYRFFDPTLDAHRQKRRDKLAELTGALAGDEFMLFYQPQVAMDTGEVTGFEALIRWRHPSGEILAPGAFLLFLEGSPLEVQFGQWVLSQAISTLQRWCDRGERLSVSVNISAAHLLEASFMPFLIDCCKAYPELDTSLLHLEVLESTALDDMSQASQVLSECRKLGLKVALDDFGTGFSSLTYFRSLPIDLIKIDQSFIRDMLEDPEDQAIVESVVFLARKFNRAVLAEGVETLDHAHALAGIGCQHIQGYGVARPMPEEAVVPWLAQWRAENPFSGNSPARP